MFFKDCKYIYYGISRNDISLISNTIQSMKNELSIMQQTGGSQIIDELQKYKQIQIDNNITFTKVVLLLKYFQKHIDNMMKLSNEKKLDELNKIIADMIEILNKRIDVK